MLQDGHVRNEGQEVMPFKSAKQANLMRAAMHDPSFAKKVGVSKKVATKFVREDQKAMGTKPKAKK